MFSWITRLFRRARTAPGDPGPVQVSGDSAPAPSQDHTPPGNEQEPEIPLTDSELQEQDDVIREMEYALLITDSGSLEDLPADDRYRQLAQQHGGMLQPTVSGLTLILFAPADAGSAISGRITFATELEKRSLARIRCLHGRALVRKQDTGVAGYETPVTLLNFHLLVQHAAALDLGQVTEAGSYHAARRIRCRA